MYTHNLPSISVSSSKKPCWESLVISWIYGSTSGDLNSDPKKWSQKFFGIMNHQFFPWWFVRLFRLLPLKQRLNQQVQWSGSCRARLPCRRLGCCQGNQGGKNLGMLLDTKNIPSQKKTAMTGWEKRNACSYRRYMFHSWWMFHRHVSFRGCGFDVGFFQL